MVEKKPVGANYAMPLPVLFLNGAASTSRCHAAHQQPFPVSLEVR